MMPGIAVVMLNINRMSFANHVPLRWRNFRKNIPCIGVESTVFQMAHFLVELPKGRGSRPLSTQATVRPVQRLMALMTQSFLFLSL
jgi:hypothetical protein